MELMGKERDRLAQRSVRFVGLAGAIIALLCLLLGGGVEPTTWVATGPGWLLLALALTAVERSGSIAWPIVGLVGGTVVLVALLLLEPLPLAEGVAVAVAALAGGAMPAFALVLAAGAVRAVLLVMATVSSVILIELLTGGSALLTPYSVAVGLGWLMLAILGYWLRVSLTRITGRIESIGRAYRAERQASEREAQRRQNARLLHDTVLASLTLLAHSGHGVNAEAMRSQAGDDARLLRQLKTSSVPDSAVTILNPAEPVDETPLGHTLESVKQRFGRMGLQVNWHGSGRLLLPADVLDAFLRAISECLENVRRHAGVPEAHVTISDDEHVVRAMIMDQGVGFDQSLVDDGRLGLKESVVARLREVGGSSRLFSAPGSGTTVVLEVPKP